MMEWLMQYISEVLPECTIKMNFNAPFYRRKKNLVYLWPSALPWGGITTGVAVGFIHGHLLSNDQGWLSMGNRKQIGIRVFNSVQELQQQAEMLNMYLLESAMIEDELSARTKKAGRTP